MVYFLKGILAEYRYETQQNQKLIRQRQFKEIKGYKLLLLKVTIYDLYIHLHGTPIQNKIAGYSFIREMKETF